MPALDQAEGPSVWGPKADAYSTATWLLRVEITGLDKDDELFNQQHDIFTQTPLNPYCACLWNNLWSSA